jgi:hypothetical protein
MIGQAKLSFPTTCPSCDHSPLEADSCTLNKALRNTMRVWLQKQKKKEEAKAAAQAATPVAETTPSATEAPSEVEGADKAVDSIEATAPVDALAESATTATDVVDGELRPVSASAQPNEVGFHPSLSSTHACMRQSYQRIEAGNGRTGRLKSINTIELARAGGCSMHISSRALADIKQESAVPEDDDAERRGSLVSQTATQSVEPSATNAASDDQDKTNGPANMMGNNPMMNGQMGFGFQGQGSFGGMGFNGMPNMMGMNPMGMLNLEPTARD